MKAHVPGFDAAAVGTRWVVTEHVDDVVEMSCEHVHAAEPVPQRLEDLQTEIQDRRAGCLRVNGPEAPTWEKTSASWRSEKHQSDKDLSLQLWMSASSSRGRGPRPICEDSSPLSGSSVTNVWPGITTAAWKSRLARTWTARSLTEEMTSSLLVLQLQVGEGQRLVPGQYCVLPRCFRRSQ